MSDRSNSKGLFPAFAEQDCCTGCAACAAICPDAAIQVLRDDSKIVDLNPSREQDACLAKEKR
jgi:NAD-dependent dihydropyrimidine dehydrogenase PreA subunit